MKFLSERIDEASRWYFRLCHAAMENKDRSIWNSIKSTVSNVMQSISSTVFSIWDNIRSAVSDKISGIKSTIQSGFDAAVGYIKGLASDAWNWGRDIIQGIIDGIQSAIGWLADCVTNVADTIRDFLHFSVSDKELGYCNILWK